MKSLIVPRSFALHHCSLFRTSKKSLVGPLTLMIQARMELLTYGTGWHEFSSYTGVTFSVGISNQWMDNASFCLHATSFIGSFVVCLNVFYSPIITAMNSN